MQHISGKTLNAVLLEGQFETVLFTESTGFDEQLKSTTKAKFSTPHNGDDLWFEPYVQYL